MTSAAYAGVREILAAPDWEPVTVTDHGQFFTISGYFRSMAHTGSRKDWESLARDLDRIAREQFDALMGKPEPAPEAEVVAVPEPKPEPQPDPRDAELEAMRAKIAEMEARELELKDANACLKDALSDIEDRIADLDDETPTPEHRFPASLDEKLTDWDIPEEGADDAEKQKIVSGFIDILKSGKDIADNTFRQMTAEDRVKLFPILNKELDRLTNEEALLNKPIPRRGDVQSLLGILAKVGET